MHTTSHDNVLPLLAQLVEPHCHRQQKLAALIFTSATPGQPLQHNKYAPWNISARTRYTNQNAGWLLVNPAQHTFTNTHTHIHGIDLTQEAQKRLIFSFHARRYTQLVTYYAFIVRRQSAQYSELILWWRQSQTFRQRCRISLHLSISFYCRHVYLFL